MSRSINAGVLIAAWTLLAAMAVIAGMAIDHAPKGRRLEAIRLLPTASPVTLGSSELGHVAQESSRLLLRRDGAGEWEMANGSRYRPLNVMRKGGLFHDSRLVTLSDGDRLELAGHALAVALPGNGLLTLTDIGSGRSAIWGKGGLQIDGEIMLASCQVLDDGVLGRVRHWLQRALSPVAEAVAWLSGGMRPAARPLFSVGGQVNCPQAWAVSWLPFQAMRVLAIDRRFVVRIEVPARVASAAPHEHQSRDLQFVWHSASGVAPVVAVETGGIRYAVATDGPDLVLRPLNGRGLFPETMSAANPGVFLEWEAGEEASWLGRGWMPVLAGVAAVPPPAAVAAVVALAAMLWPRRHSRLAIPPAIAVFVSGSIPLVAGGAVMLSQGDPDLAALLTLVALTWGWASLVLALKGRLVGLGAVMWLAATFVAGLGIIAHLQLGIGMATESYLSIPRKTAAALVMTAMVVATIALAPPSLVVRIIAGVFFHGSAPLAAFRWLAGLAVVIGLLTQVGAGKEAGLGFSQPSEAAKTAMACVLGYIASLFLHYVRLNSAATRGWAVLRLAGIGLTTLVIVFGALLLVDDRSPLLVLAVMCLGWLATMLVQVRATLDGRRAVAAWVMLPAALALAIGLSAAGGIAWLAGAPESVHDLFGSKVGRRLQGWSDPLGQAQTAQALAIAADAPFWPDAGQAFGPNGVERRLPEVENDLVLSFLLSRFGVAVVAVLVAVQVAYILALFAAAAACLNNRGPFLHRLVATFLGFATGGLAAIQACQWLIGFGNALALTPIMGQASTYLSAGMSSVLFFGLPVLVFGLLAVDCEH